MSISSDYYSQCSSNGIKWCSVKAMLPEPGREVVESVLYGSCAIMLMLKT
jgi:hypothetical protein